MTRPTALVTGASAGIGFHTAAALAAAGMRVLITGRDHERGESAAAQLRAGAGHSEVEWLSYRADSLGETRALADLILAREPRLDVLVNNVGGLYAERRETEDGLEAQLALNFVAPFALTARLLPMLLRAHAARIVQVVSSAFDLYRGDPFADLEQRQRYVGLQVHARAKLLSLCAALALSRELATTRVQVNAVNPGMAWTPGTQALTRAAVPAWRFVWPLVRFFQRRASPAGAARGPILLASTESLRGSYFDGTRPKQLPGHVRDHAQQARALALAVELSGERLGSQVIACGDTNWPSHKGG